MYTAIKELEKCECVSSVMTIASVLHIEREPMDPLFILLIIDDGVYVCIYSVYFNISKLWTKHAFLYDIYFTTTENSACQGAIIDNRRYAPIYVLKKKTKKKSKLKIMLRNFFEGICIVKYAFKITSRDS